MPNFKSSAPGNGTKLIETKTESFRVRKLTQRECWRLMGFDDQDFDRAREALNQNIYNGKDRSGSQLYKQAGNSIVVDVLEAIMRELYEAMPYLFDDMVIGSFFSGIGAFEKALSQFDCNALNNLCDSTPDVDDALHQIGYINDYNGDANRVYDSESVARVLKAEAGGGGAKTGWYKCKTVCLNSKVNGKQPSLCNRIYDPSGVATAVTTSDFFMPNYQIKEEVDNDRHGSD